ncbi:MAG: hypothetical protein HY306_11265 [Nitrosomonadales bacterium]|nr:hypothetical protein [Nitrosomonadales bacterium]
MRNILKIVFAGLLLALPLLAHAAPKQKVWVPGWKDTSPLNHARAGVASVHVKNHVYIIGGYAGRDWLATTEYAKINKDGTLGPWQYGPQLNEERGFMSAIVHDDYVYVVGGGNGPSGHHLLNSIERAHINKDGTLGPWVTEKNGMMVGRRCSKILATDKELYSFGGFGGVLLDSVEHAAWQPDGSLGEWHVDAEVMTIPRYVNSVKKEGDVFFVLGGHDQTKGVGITNVEWSRPNPDGSMQKWQATTPMQQGRYGFLTSAYGDYLYALGGLSGMEYLDTIERTTVGKDGQLSPWKVIGTLDQQRANFGVIDDDKRIYIIGGSSHDGFIANAVYAERNQDGDIGYWGTEAEAQAVRDRLAARKVQKVQLPYQGLVKEVIQTDSYTYIQVETPGDGSLAWLAASKIPDLHEGDTVNYSKGVRMANFHSKELDRYFPLIQFVSQAQKK